ncbi:MAG: ClbS/DfsB family four-helix bundle protein [Anaerolineae bacterium]|nr:ClbS/DfsB family four-helix bundle protein [Anaerolineae bacterium]
MENEILPGNTADLLERIERSWDELWATIDGPTEEQLQRPDAGGWSVKDNLAHVTAWERYMLLHYLQGLPAGEAMGIGDPDEYTDYNEINAALFNKNRARSLADVTESARAVHRQVVDYLASVPFETLMQQMYDDDPEKRPVLVWVAGNTYEHYEEHLDMIRVLVGETD